MSAVVESRGGAGAGCFWRETLAEVRRDQLIHGIVLIYALIVAVVAFAIGQPEKLGFFNYAVVWLKVLFALVLAVYVAIEVPASIRADPGEPLARLKTRLPGIVTPRVAAGLVLILTLILAQGAFTSAKNLLPAFTAFTWDQTFANLDKAIHGGKDPWLWLQPVMGHHAVTRGVQMLYTGGWLLILCGVTFAVASMKSLAPLRTRFFLTYLFSWIVLGNIAAGIFMSAGPVYFGQVTGDAARFAAQMDYLSFSKGALHSSYDIQRDLWAVHAAGRAELGSGISAFPSLHLATATLFMLTAWKVNRWWGMAATAFAATILAGSVHLAWHYAVDGYASIVVVIAVWFGFGGIERLMTRTKARA